MVHLSKSLEDTEKIAATFITAIKIKTEKQAMVVGLFGDLGSGKTTFTQAVARKLGVTETVTSPTYVIEKIYKISHKHFTHLIHIDAYRLEASSELLHLGWKEISENPKNLILLEWPEKVADILPSDMMQLKFSFIDETKREITF